MANEWKSATKYIVGVGLAIFGLYILYLSRSVISLLVIAALIAFLVRPLINLLHERLRVPRRIAVLLTYLITAIILLLAPLIIVPPIVDAVNYLLSLDYQLLIDNFLSWLGSNLIVLRDTGFQILSFKIELQNTIDPILAALQNTSPSFSLEPPSIDVIFNSLGSAFAVSYGLAVGVVGSVFSGIVAFLFMILAAIYLSLDAQKFYDNFLAVVPDSQREEINRIVNRLRFIWDAFFRGQITLMIFIGFVVWLGLTILGLPGAFALGVIAGVLEIIPNLGPFLSAIPAVIVALLQGSSVLSVNNFVFALIIIGFYILVQMLENYFVVPKVLGEAVELHPLVVISGVLIGAAVWGILGALLATPLIASGREIVHYLYRKTLGEDPFPTIEKPPEEESLSLRESMQNLVAKSQQALKRDSDSSKDQSETELDD
jgi:predicted PurR-regulated permease PerM